MDGRKFTCRKRGKGTTDFPCAWISLTPTPDMVSTTYGCLRLCPLLNKHSLPQRRFQNIRLEFIIVAMLDTHSLHSLRRNVGGCCLKLLPEISLSISLKYVHTLVISKVCLRGRSLVSPYMTLILKTP